MFSLDPLTGLQKSLHLYERLIKEIEQSRHHDFPLSLMMIDVDNFQSYNNRFSHLEGNRVLQSIAVCMKEFVRENDLAVRYGGEEFCILLPQTTSNEARSIAELIRLKVAAADSLKCQVTISIGVASLSPSMRETYDIINAADLALYEAKRNGRNNVQVFDDSKGIN